MRIMGICGSLRSAAYSLTVLQALRAAAPPSIDISVCRLHDIPMFDPDHRDVQNELPSVKAFRQAIIAADGIVIATPEYNHSIPGALKNALEWLHGRPGLLEQKPVAVVSSTPGPNGGVHAQRALRSILKSMGSNVLAEPELAFADVRNKFDAGGAPVEAATGKALEAFMLAVRDWIASPQEH
jgi:chromate reductase, NAD(P)H dehydrogenase (quinone)